jgi:hypothetical protein
MRTLALAILALILPAAAIAQPCTPTLRGFTPPSGTPGLARVSLAVLGERLYIAGEFYNIGSTVADHFAYIEACPRTCTADFNYDGDAATDADIEAFFACLAGNCCPNCASADFNGDGDVGNDADIESFFRVLAGGTC